MKAVKLTRQCITLDKKPEVPKFSKKFATVCFSVTSSCCVTIYVYILQFIYLQAWWLSLLGLCNPYFF